MPSPELLRFFHSEARDYLDAVEELASGDATFDAGAFVAASRALRGSATMARVPRVGEIALSMERIANGVRDGEVDWSPRLRSDLVDAITDLRGRALGYDRRRDHATIMVATEHRPRPLR